MAFVMVCFHVIVGKPFKKFQSIGRIFERCYGIYRSITRYKRSVIIEYCKRSHIKILNNKGPNIDPCGTPNKISS